MAHHQGSRAQQNRRHAEGFCMQKCFLYSAMTCHHAKTLLTTRPTHPLLLATSAFFSRRCLLLTFPISPTGSPGNQDRGASAVKSQHQPFSSFGPEQGREDGLGGHEELGTKPAVSVPAKGKGGVTNKEMGTWRPRTRRQLGFRKRTGIKS